MEHLKVILADDNVNFRNAFKSLLEKEYNIEIIGEASNGTEFNMLENLHCSDIIFMDLMMPDIDGIRLVRQTLWKIPNLKFIAITMHTDNVYLSSLIEAGFKGCIFKNDLYNELQQAIETVKKGKLYFPKHIPLSSSK